MAVRRLGGILDLGLAGAERVEGMSCSETTSNGFFRTGVTNVFSLSYRRKAFVLPA
jgi:hypothetical protein